MPVDNPYLNQFTNSLAQAGQVAEQLKQAAAQHMQWQEMNRRANQEMAMRQAEHADQLAQSTLQNKLAMNSMGATPVSDQGTVPSMLPSMNGSPQAMPTPDPMSGIAGHQAFQTAQPALGTGHTIVTLPGDNSRYQIPTASEQYGTELQREMQKAVAQHQAMSQFNPTLPDADAKVLNLPTGMHLAPADLEKFIGASTTRTENTAKEKREGAASDSLANYRNQELGVRNQELGLSKGRLGVEQARLGLEQKKDQIDKNPESLFTPAELQAYYEGRVKLPARGQDRERITRAITNTIDPEFDQSNADARFATRKGFSAGKEADNVKGIETAAGHLKQLENISGQLGGSPIGFGTGHVLNALKEAAGSTGAKDLGKYKLVQTALTSDLEKVLGGSKAMEGQRNLMDRLSPDMPPQVRQEALGEVRQLLGTRHQALADQWSSTMGTTPAPGSLGAAADVLNGKQTKSPLMPTQTPQSPSGHQVGETVSKGGKQYKIRGFTADGKILADPL